MWVVWNTTSSGFPCVEKIENLLFPCEKDAEASLEVVPLIFKGSQP